MFDRFRELLADYAKVDIDNVYPFIGADGALRSIFFVLTKPGDKVLYVNPTFAMIPIYAENRGLISVTINSFEDGDWWRVNVEELLEKAKGVDIAVLADPNNPTGGPILAADMDSILALAKAVKGYVVIDETYFEFAGYTAAPYVNEVSNLIVVRSLSKSFCIAGFRLGYVIASKEVIERLSSIHTPFDIPTPSLAAGVAALEDRYYVTAIVAEVKRLRDMLYENLKSLGFKAYRSLANFITLKDERDIYEVLKKHGIYIKKLSGNLYRITVPPHEAICRKIVEVLAEEL